jgi:hypothetical protein
MGKTNENKKMVTVEKDIATISRLIDVVSNHFFTHHPYNPRVKEIWFRGQPRFEYCLIPAAFRDRDKNGPITRYDEGNALEDFQAHFPEHRTDLVSTIEWLTMMQHYGLPTRLLDWSRSLLVALYFAVNQDEDADGAIYAINPRFFCRNWHLRPQYPRHQLISLCVLFNDTVPLVEMINKDPVFTAFGIKASVTSGYDVSFEPDENADLHDSLRAVYMITPPRSNQRLAAQQGTFTLHGGKKGASLRIDPFDLENEVWERGFGKSLLKIRIKKEFKKAFRKELDFSGVSTASLFPEMEYQAEYIKERNILRPDSLPDDFVGYRTTELVKS